MGERTGAEGKLLDALNDTNIRYVELLLSKGANPNLIVSDGVAAVHLAAGIESEKGLRCLKLILQHGADPNLRTSDDMTPLHIAASWGCYQNLRLLLRNGGNPNLRDQGGNKPSDLAAQEENSKCANLLQEYETRLSQERNEGAQFQNLLYSATSMNDTLFSLDPSEMEPLCSTRLSACEEQLNNSQDVCYSKSFNEFHRVYQNLRKLSSTSVSVLEQNNSVQGQALACDVNALNPQIQSFPPDLIMSPRKSQPHVGFNLPLSEPNYNLHASLDQSSDITLDLSQYPDFLDTERMTTVLKNQGIDVTHQDDVFIFSKMAYNALDSDIDKTVVGYGHLEKPGVDSDEDKDVFVSIVQPHISSESSEYNSCESDVGRSPIISPVAQAGKAAQDRKRPQETRQAHSKVEETTTEIQFIPSPFVTGRTRSRLSRHSARMSQNLSLAQSRSFLFEQSLPSPARSYRNTVMSGGSKAEDIHSQMSSLRVSTDSSTSHQAYTQMSLDSMAETVIISENSTDSPLGLNVDVIQVDTSCPEKEHDQCSTTPKERQSCPQESNAASFQEKNLECVSTNGQPKAQMHGFNPRYSINRLSGHLKNMALSDLSSSPNDMMDEPVEYLYTDTEQGHKLIETHLPPTFNTSLSSSISTSSSEDTVLYDWCSLPPETHHCNAETDFTIGLTDKQLRLRLIEVGVDPGPINHQTRPLYVQKLKRSLHKVQESQMPVHPSPAPCNGYSPELEQVVQNFLLPDCQMDELTLCEQFDQPNHNKKWREGFLKSSFNYLLLDPRVSNNLPYRSQALMPKDCFQTFISAVFYVGKGKRSRPYSHLYEALEYFNGDKTSKNLCSKVQHILQIWKAGHGVISLHCFQNVIAVEAYTREACMVDAVGLEKLTNKKKGDYYGVVSTWPAHRKRKLGVHLLYRAMQIFLAEGERQLRPADIR